MNNNISNRQLNISSAGQIALNLDKKDGQDGVISQSVWEEFWKTNDSESKYKGKKETNAGQNGISVRDAMKLIMTRIFNAANSLGEEVNKIGDKWLNGIENKEQIDANTIEELKEDTKEEPIKNNNSLDCAKNAMRLINQNIKNIQLPQGMSAEQFTKNLKEAYEEQIADLPSKTTVADMTQSILTTAFRKGKNLSDTEKTDLQKIALRNAAKLAPDDEICGVKCSEILNNEEAAFNKLFDRQFPVDSQDDETPENKALLEQTQRVLDNLKNNIDKIELPENVSRDEFINKLNSFDVNRMLVLAQKEYRNEKGHGLPENQSDADVAAAILSEVLGIHDDKNTRTIKSNITIRQNAINNTLNIYSDNDTIRGTSISQIKESRDAHKKVLNEAIEYIERNFNSSGLSAQVDKDLFIQCLKSATLDIENGGAGRNEDGIFVIETNDNDILNWNKENILETDNVAKTRMIKLLIHETYHNYLDLKDEHTEGATKKEEAMCEMLALMATANLCKKDSNLTPFNEYNKSIGAYLSKDAFMNNEDFVNYVAGYTDHSGEVNQSIKEAKEDIKL